MKTKVKPYLPVFFSVLLKGVLVALLIALTVIFAVGCGKNQSVSFGGVTMDIPKDFEAKNVEFTQCCYTSDKVMLMIDVFLTEDIYEQLGYSSDITLEEYMDEFCKLNGQKDVSYDDARKMAHFTEYNPDGDRYYSYYFFRTEKALYFVSFNCLKEYEEEYRSLFDKWAATIEVK